MNTDLQEEDRLLSSSEAAAVLGCKPDTLPVWRCRNSPSIPYHRIGKLVRYSRKDLDEFLAKNRVDRSGDS